MAGAAPTRNYGQRWSRSRQLRNTGFYPFHATRRCQRSRDGQNDVIVRYFSQNHGVSVTNALFLLQCSVLYSTVFKFFSIFLQLNFRNVTPTARFFGF